MKKLTFIFLILILSIGCNKKTIEKNDNNTTTTTTTTTKPAYVDDNPIKLGLYQYINSNTNRKLLTTYETIWENDIDIGSFEVFYTNDEQIPNSAFQTLWANYYNNYPTDISKYKIGYHIHFTFDNGSVVDKNILRPSDADEFYHLLQIYLYDDAHQPIGKWYSHVTDEEYNDATLLTSIKLTNSTYTSNIDSDIELTVFTYDQDDFDSNNQYRGNSKYTILIKRK